MKKYITPEINVNDIEPELMLSGSINIEIESDEQILDAE